MSDNDDFLIVEGQSPDWIELFNPTDSAVLLSNFYLSDNAEELQNGNFQQKYFLLKLFSYFMPQDKTVVLIVILKSIKRAKQSTFLHQQQ